MRDKELNTGFCEEPLNLPVCDKGFEPLIPKNRDKLFPLETGRLSS